MRIAATAGVLAIGVLTVLGAPAAHARASVAKQDLIEFSSYRTTSVEYYAVHADGTGLEELPGIEYLAPTGRAVAHLEGGCGSGELSVETAGGVERHLDTGGHVCGFGWSPDGTRIVYADSRPGQPLTVIDVRSGRKVTLPPGENPSWAPDGNHIAFFRPSANGGNDLWVVGADGSRPDLLHFGAYDKSLRWAPNGQLIAFIANDELWTVSLAPKGSARFHQIADWLLGLGEMSWSPDSTRIVFDTRDVQRPNGTYTGSVFVANADGTHRHRLVKGAFLTPRWSPAGNQIALAGTRYDSKRWTGLFVLRPDGRGLRKLLGADTYSADWSADGRRLVAATSDDIWIADLGGHPRRIGQGWRYGYENDGGKWLPSGTPDRLLHGRPVSWSLPTDSVVTSNLLKSPAPVAYLAADGTKVAVGYDNRRFGYPDHPIRWCLETWDTASGQLTRFAQTQCVKPSYCCSLGASGMGDFAFAGDRLSWVRLDHFAGRDLIDLDTSTAAAPAPASLSFCDSGCVFDVEAGGSLTVFDSWYESCANPSYPMPCAFAPRNNDKLYRVDGDRAVQIASSPTALAPLSVDAGRVLVDHQNGTLEILSSTGSSLGIVHYQPGDFLGAKLQGNDVVVVTNGFVEDYAADTGTLLHQWPLAAGAPRLEGVSGGVAVYVSGSFVYIVRLADGRTVALPQLGRDPHAQITAAGLFYGYTVDDPTYPGRVAFTPFGQLPFD